MFVIWFFMSIASIIDEFDELNNYVQKKITNIATDSCHICYP